MTAPEGGVPDSGAVVEPVALVESVLAYGAVDEAERQGREVCEEDEKELWGGSRPGNRRILDRSHSFQTSAVHGEGSRGLFGVCQQQQHEGCVVIAVARPAQHILEWQHQQHGWLQRGLGWQPQGLEEQVAAEVREAELDVGEGGQDGRSASGQPAVRC